ncbi:MBL fold metallo-hydrolase [Candidatus Parcubacteria bacterium]|nr:MBL fold metallo-hydrolase [Candidatus Parcubacteria bacterium]
MKLRERWKFLIIAIVALANVFIWFAVQAEKPHDYVTVAFLNIGQGDAIFIESPTGNQLMIDGGPARKVLSELRKVMPFFDRSINTLLVTNPDADHYAGFIDILRSYKVDQIIQPGTDSETPTYAFFNKEVLNEGASTTAAHRGMVYDLGGGAKLYILFPDRDISNLDSNSGSTIAKLVYKNTSVMLTGDATSNTEEYVANLGGDIPDGGIQADVLKIGHHGSRTSASEIFLKAVNPKTAVISFGCNNRYGHPHKETTELLKKLNIPYYTTCEQGTIIMKLDGENITTEFKK